MAVWMNKTRVCLQFLWRVPLLQNRLLTKSFANDSTKHKSRELPSIVKGVVSAGSAPMPLDSVTVEGYDFNEGIDYEKLLGSMKRTGFQALHFGQAVDEINNMLRCRDLPLECISDVIEERYKPKSNCTIFLGYTSNMASAGVRDVIRFLVEHKLVDVIVTTAGGIEEDFMKCMAPTYLGDFKLKGSLLNNHGWNRQGNLIIPNYNYTLFNDWFQPLLTEMLKEQNEHGVNWTPSKMIAKMGENIDDCKSIYYWAYKNDIPVFCPGITDGNVGDNIYVHSYREPGLRLDIAEDVTCMDNIAVYSKNTGQVSIGGGLAKHHICNANSMRSGADFCVYLNTAGEFDGSDAGAYPDEAVSWGKIKASAKPIKVFADATLTFPLIVAETFAKYHYNKKKISR